MISPCVKICSLSDGLCVGCRRSVAEIQSWRSMTLEDKKLWWDKNPMYYAGIGSRETPPQAMARIELFSDLLAAMQYTLSSGAAKKGADQAFEKKATRKRIFVPERAVRDQISFLSLSEDVQKKALELAEKHHPRWDRVTDIYSKRLLARNVNQVLGPDLITPVDFVLFWAKYPSYDQLGRIVDTDGGTGLAVRLASSLNIPCIHIDRPEFNDFYKCIARGDLVNMHKILNEMKSLMVMDSGATFRP